MPQLSKQLQRSAPDLVQATVHIREVEATPVQMQESGYPEVLQTVERPCQPVNLQHYIPCLIASQGCPNYVATFTVEECFRLLVCLHFLDRFSTLLLQ